MNFKKDTCLDFTHDKEIKRADILTEALPYISCFSGKTIVIKYGGNAMDDPNILRTIMQDIATLKIVGVNPILIHGGGPEINSQLKRLDIKSEFISGMRVTTKETMEVVQMTLAGKVNKDIVSTLNTLGVKAVGLCGKDGNLIQVDKMDEINGVDYGFVGNIKAVDTSILKVLQQDFIPVISTIGVDSKGQSYNINADIAAGFIGGCLRAEKLMFLTDIDGIRTDEKDADTLLSNINVGEIDELIKSGQISGGMLPKVNACTMAIKKGCESVTIINGTIPHSILLELFTDSGIGTMVTK